MPAAGFSGMTIGAFSIMARHELTLTSDLGIFLGMNLFFGPLLVFLPLFAKAAYGGTIGTLASSTYQLGGGHPVGASGLRMAFEVYLQLLGRAGARQLKNPQLGLSHNLGGVPYNGVCSISIVGLEGR